MKIPSVLVLVGTDEFQKRLFLDDLIAQLFPNGSTGFNDDRMDAKERSVSEVIDLCNTLPMLAERRLILIRNAEKFNESDQQKWAEYFENPSPQTQLIFTAEKLDKRTKFFKTVDKLGFVREVAPPNPREISVWIDKLAKRHQVEVKSDAKQALVEALGVNLGLIDQQLEKLALYAHPEKIVTKEAVSTLVLQVTGDHIFAWTDQVVEGKLSSALTTLNFLLEQGNPALVVLTMLARHIRILIKAKDATKKNIPSREMAPILGVPPFTVNKYLDQARGFTMDQLYSVLEELSRLDHEFKSTGLPSQMLLERTLERITAERRTKGSSPLFSS